jgi:hypothetical protein
MRDLDEARGARVFGARFNAFGAAARERERSKVRRRSSKGRKPRQAEGGSIARAARRRGVERVSGARPQDAERIALDDARLDAARSAIDTGVDARVLASVGSRVDIGYESSAHDS